MPIRPENKDRYPKNWTEIRTRILARAGNKCEICGVGNYAIGWRDQNGEFHEDYPDDDSIKMIRIILTVAHLNHQPEDCRPKNLKALCQRCHNSHDMKTRAAGIRQRKRKHNLELPI